MSFDEVTRNEICIPPQTPYNPMLISEEEFTEILICYFRPYLDDDTNDNHSENVEFIWKSSKYFSRYFENEELEDIYIEVIFSLFEVLRCTNYAAIRNLLENFALRTLQFYGFVDLDIDVQPPLRRLPSTQFHYCVEPLSNEHFSIDSFFYPLLFLELETVQRLLRYGVPLYLKNHCASYYMSFILNSINDQHLTSNVPTIESENQEKGLIDLYPTNHKRMNIVLLGLHVLCVEREYRSFKNYQNYAKSLKLIFKTIREPFIALSEISTFLNLHLTVENKERTIGDYCDKFAEDFPKSRNPLQPRTLKHLCRCEVRECLGKARKLPHGVWDLNVPRTIQNYILIQKYEEEFHPEYVSALSINKSF